MVCALCVYGVCMSMYEYVCICVDVVIDHRRWGVAWGQPSPSIPTPSPRVCVHVNARAAKFLIHMRAGVDAQRAGLVLAFYDDVFYLFFQTQN